MTRSLSPASLVLMPLLLSLSAMPVRSAEAQVNESKPKPRARDLGVPFEGTPGKFNAITDVAGVEVGHATLIEGEGELVVGKGPVRTGVTVLFPRGKDRPFERCFAAWHTLNGNGEMTGIAWVGDSGYLRGPVAVTNTHSVGVVRDALIDWHVKKGDKQAFHLPVVAETYDGTLSDINGFHVKPAHVFAALDKARGGHVPEGNVGGGTGMICYDFKGGIGTSSRVLAEEEGGYTVGVLVQANYGSRPDLRVAGVPVGREVADLRREIGRPDELDLKPDRGSIIIFIATDAPLIPTHLERLCKRASLGLGRLGSIASDTSGDIFLAFSTANATAISGAEAPAKIEVLPTERITPLFRATIEATEEAVVNAMVAAETMTGRDGNTLHALPHDRLRAALKKYGRLEE
ncbi:MAG: P1 family peptidase [Planctomycetaceae bacterium]